MRQHLAVWFRRAVNERLADGGSEVVVELCRVDHGTALDGGHALPLHVSSLLGHRPHTLVHLTTYATSTPHQLNALTQLNDLYVYVLRITVSSVFAR